MESFTPSTTTTRTTMFASNEAFNYEPRFRKDSSGDILQESMSATDSISDLLVVASSSSSSSSERTHEIERTLITTVTLEEENMSVTNSTTRRMMMMTKVPLAASSLHKTTRLRSPSEDIIDVTGGVSCDENPSNESVTTRSICQPSLSSLSLESTTAPPTSSSLLDTDNDDKKQQQQKSECECECECESKREPQKLHRSQSFINSLPVAMAVPDLQPHHNSHIVVSATEVVRLTPSSSSLMDADTSSSSSSSSSHGHRKRGGMISVKIFKETKSTKLGIRFQNSHGSCLSIAKLTGKLALSETASLQVGDQVLRIDGISVSGWSPVQAVQYLKNRIGFVSLTARNPSGDPTRAEAVVYKSRPEDKLGISFSTTKNNKNDDDDDDDKLCIQTLNVAGLLGSRSILQVGDQVESINQVPCSQVDPTLAVNIIRSSPDMVTLVVKNSAPSMEFPSAEMATLALSNTTTDTLLELEDPHSSSEEDITIATELEVAATSERDDNLEPAFVSVLAYKATHDTKLGIKLACIESKLYIARLIDGGLLATSPLQGGMQLLSINHVACKHWSAQDALQYLRKTVGPVQLLAYHAHGNPEYIQAMVYKHHLSSKKDKKNKKKNPSVGISFKGSANRQLKICEVRADGLFVQSAINVGDKIVTINGISCQNKRPREAVEIVHQAHNTVTILARTKTSVGVVVSRYSRY